MNVHEIADEYGLPIKKLQRLAKAGLLVTTPGDDRPHKMRSYLASNRHLSVAQLLDLMREPALFDQLGKLGTYEAKARKQLKALGDVKAGAIPTETAANLIYGAAIAELDSLEKLASWIKSTVPPGGCSYHYLAARMLFNVPGGRFAVSYNFLQRAILNLRNMPALAGWSSKGSEPNAPTKFHRPTETVLDL